MYDINNCVTIAQRAAIDTARKLEQPYFADECISEAIFHLHSVIQKYRPTQKGTLEGWVWFCTTRRISKFIATLNRTPIKYKNEGILHRCRISELKTYTTTRTKPVSEEDWQHWTSNLTSDELCIINSLRAGYTAREIARSWKVHHAVIHRIFKKASAKMRLKKVA